MALHLFDSVDRFGRKQRGAMTLLRERLGDPLPFEIEDNAILNAINAAIVEYSRLRPRMQEMTLNIKSGQESYVLGQSLVELQPVDGVEGEPETPNTLDNPEEDTLPELFGCLIDGQTYVLDVVDCIFAFKGQMEMGTFQCDEVYTQNVYRRGTSPYSYIPIDERHPFPSELFINTLFQDTADRYKGYDWTYYQDTDTLSVIPAPTETGITKIKVKLMHSPNTIPDKDVELVLLYALADAMETLANFRGKVKSLPTGVGFKMVLDGGAELYKVAERKRAEFYSRFYTGGSHHTTG